MIPFDAAVLQPQSIHPGTGWQRLWYVPILIVYVAVVFVAVAYHEPWFDEAQSWLIARDCSPWYMISQAMRYEGSPGLWHLILVLPAKCHWPYLSANVIGASIASVGIWLFLRYSPLPKPVTAIVPFTYFLAYQYAAIARNYVLFPVLLFAIASIYRRRLDRPWVFIGLLIFLANVTAHGFLIAGCFATLFVIDVARGWRQRSTESRKGQLRAILLYGVASVIVVLQLWPAPDCATKTGVTQGLIDIDRMRNALDVLNGSFCDTWIFTLIVLCLSGWWFLRTGVLTEWLFPSVVTCVFFALVRAMDHHEGILFALWVFALWRSFEEYDNACRRGLDTRSLRWTRNAVLACVLPLLGYHSAWTIFALRHEIDYAYCGSRSAASLLSESGLSAKRIAATHEWAIALLPYFPTNIYANYHNGFETSFVNWRESLSPLKLAFSRDLTLHDQYDVIVMPVNVQAFSMLDWEDSNFSPRLSTRWRYVAYCPGRIIKKWSHSFGTGYAIYVLQELADQLKLGEWGRAGSSRTDTIAITAPKHSDEERTLALAGLHLQFGALLRGTEPESAIEHYSKLLALSVASNSAFDRPSWALMKAYCHTAHNNMGALLTRSHPVQASEHYLAAIRLKPKSSHPYVNLGNILVRQGRMEEAIQYYRHALVLEPQNETARRNLELVTQSL